MPWRRQGGESDIVIENFAHVDAAVLFAHNLAALQVMAEKQLLVDKDVQVLQDETEDISLKLIRIAEYRGQEWQTAAQIRGLRTAVEKEVEAVQHHLSVIKDREEAKRKGMANQTAQEHFLLNLEYELAVARAEFKKSSAAILRQEEQELTLALGEREERLKLESGLASLNFTSMFRRQQLVQEAEIMGQVSMAAAQEAAAIERENEDLRLRQIHAEALEARRAMQEGLTLFFSFVGDAAANLLDRPLLMAKALSTILAVISALVITRQLTLFLREYLIRKFARPALIREAKRTTFFQHLTAFLFQRKRASSLADELEGIFMYPDLQSQIVQLIKSTQLAHARGSSLRHVLLHGPPGTGKTLLAKRIAVLSGLDFAVMSGGDLGPLGSQAVTELQKVLKWSRSSVAARKGLLLLIDEAEAALADRTKVSLSEGGKNALNALLYETGEQSNDLMLVLATSRPEDMDIAVLDRMDEMICLDLPGPSERKEMLDYLVNRYIRPSKKTSMWNTILSFTRRPSPPQIHLEGINLQKVIKQLVSQTEGFSGRELYKIIMSMQAKVYGTAGCILTEAIWKEVIGWKIEEFHSKQRFIHSPKIQAFRGHEAIKEMRNCIGQYPEQCSNWIHPQNVLTDNSAATETGSELSDLSAEPLEPEVTPYNNQKSCPETMEEVGVMASAEGSGNEELAPLDQVNLVSDEDEEEKEKEEHEIDRNTDSKVNNHS